MLYGLIKNIMVKSMVAILLSTNVVGNTTTETKTVENIDNNTKIEEKVTEEVVKEEIKIEEKEEEKVIEEEKEEETKEETEITTEEVTEEEIDVEEEDVYEWKNEIIAEEIANNPNFEEQYNELLNIYNDYNRIISYRSPNYMKEQHEQVKDEWRKEWVNQLYAMELDENSILNELKISLISLVKLDYGYENCSDIIYRINNNL